MDGEQGIWIFSDEARTLMLRATADFPELHAVVARAQREPELDDAWEVTASLEDLDELYSLVEALADELRGRRQRELLEELRFSLSTALDGF
jgi:hypothetical protein